MASLLMRCKRHVPVVPSVPSLRSSHDGVAHCFASLAVQSACACGAVGPSLRSSHDGVAHCFASLALQTACACGAVGPFASLVTGRRRSLLRFSCVANDVCLWRRRSPRFVRHMTASLMASLLMRCKRRVPVAPSVPSLRSSQDSVAHCFASRARRESSLHPMRTYTLPQLRRHVPLGRDERSRSTPCAHTFAHTPHATKVSAEPEILSEANTKPTLVGTRTNER